MVVGLFVGTYALDQAAYRGDLQLPAWVLSGTADTARQILTAIAAAIITVVGIVFSITIVALTLASTQFGPRMMRNFIRDRGTRLTLGTFVATFFYVVLALVSIGGGPRGDFVPHLSITVALGLTLVDLAVLIYFINHIATVIQLPQVIAGIAGDLAREIDARGSGDRSTGFGTARGPSGEELLRRMEESGAVIRTPASGYLQVIRHDTLLKIATAAEAVIHLPHRPGHFLVRGQALANVWPAEAAEYVGENLQRGHVTGPYRTLTQDISFGFDQLVEIALRALSPAVQRHIHGVDVHRLARRLLVPHHHRMAPATDPARRHRPHTGDRPRGGFRQAHRASIRKDPPGRRGDAGGDDPTTRRVGKNHRANVTPGYAPDPA